MIKSKFKLYRQPSVMDCGPTCLRMISKYYGKNYSLQYLKQLAGFNKQGVSLLGISTAAEKIGFRTRGVKLTTEMLYKERLPMILFWDQDHFVVLIEIKKNKVIIADPASDIITYNILDFEKHWLSTNDDSIGTSGIALLLEPTPTFYELKDEKDSEKVNLKTLFNYLRTSKPQLQLILFALLFSALIQFAFPFLAQSVVDIGITTQNIDFIVLILMAQITLVISKAAIDFIRSRIVLKISNIVNLQILSDFWIKLTKLPLSYFETHQVGDTMQRIDDHKEIQSFFTGTTLETLFSSLNFIIFSIVLVQYNMNIFILFIAFSILYLVWIQAFLKIRRKLNYQSFNLYSKENNATLQLVQGMQEIRLNNADRPKRWEWENIQVKLFKLRFKTLNYSQIQQSGGLFIIKIEEVIIVFLAAKFVIDNQITLGTMIAIQYIIAQLSVPIQQWASFIQEAQDAKISLERLNEVHSLDDEEDIKKDYINILPQNKSIYLENVSFSYPGTGNKMVLKNITTFIPEKKVTAIVGSSGSGKTTLLRLILKIFEEYTGEISVGTEISDDRIKKGINLNLISHSFWRSQCGSVLQEGFIFNDSILKNIAIGEEEIDMTRLIESLRIANIESFINSLPNGLYTKLGVEGIGLSQGQKQRILIARVVYKNPYFLFFDEATNSLDASNEREILENLRNIYKNKTVIVVAHRLSTVKNADKIIVIENGQIVEEGSHENLIKAKSAYFKLVKNQLELGL